MSPFSISGRRILLAAFITLINSPARAETADAEGDSAAAAAADSAADAMSASPVEPTTAQGERREASEEIEVVGERSDVKQILLQPRSIGLVTRQEMKRSDGLFLEESLNLVPGVRMESRSLSGGQRITIRGYGNATNFNGTGYKAYLNGVPITDAEGITILDDIDFSTLEKVEVIKGPASSLYGAGIGGVVKMYTLRPPPRTTRFTQETLGGSLSLFRTNTRVEHATDSSAVVVNYGHQHSDGYRVHNQSRKDYVLVTADHEASAKQSLSAYAAFNHSYDQLAGQLTQAQFLNRDQAFEQPYIDNNAHVAIDSLRLAIAHRYQFQPWIGNVTTVYGSGYQLDQAFAFGRTDNMSLNYGARTDFMLNFGGPNLGLSGVVGSEVQRTNAFKKSYNFQPARGGAGDIRGDLEVVSFQANVFTQWDLLLPLEFTVTGGVSVNFVHFNITDRLANYANPTHLNQSGVRDFPAQFMPRVAVQKSFDRALTIYGQISRGYTPPASGTVVIPQTGAVNTDLKPERATLYEIGSKGDLMNGRVLYEVALFDLYVNNKFTPQSVTGSGGSVLYSFTTNAGSQNDRGIEVAAKYAVIRDNESPVSFVQPFVSYAFSNFRYDDFKSDTNPNRAIDFSGKKVVGVPINVVNVGLDAALKWGFYLYATYQFVGSEPLTFDNAHSAKSYSLLNAKLGYRGDLTEHFHVDVFAGGNNLTGSLYYTFVFLNASYIDTTRNPPVPIDPNVYLNGPYSPIFYGGVNLTYSL